MANKNERFASSPCFNNWRLPLQHLVIERPENHFNRVQSALERIMFHAYRAILSRQKARKQMHCEAIGIAFCWFWCRKQGGKHKGYNVSLHICGEVHLMSDTMAGTFLHCTEQLAVTPWHGRTFYNRKDLLLT